MPYFEVYDVESMLKIEFLEISELKNYVTVTVNDEEIKLRHCTTEDLKGYQFKEISLFCFGKFKDSNFKLQVQIKDEQKTYLLSLNYLTSIVDF